MSLKPAQGTDTVSTTQTVMMKAARRDQTDGDGLFDPTMPAGAVGPWNNGAIRVRGRRHGPISTADSGLQPTLVCEVPFRGEPGFKETKRVPMRPLVTWPVPAERVGFTGPTRTPPGFREKHVAVSPYA